MEISRNFFNLTMLKLLVLLFALSVDGSPFSKTNELEEKRGLYLAINPLAFIDNDGKVIKRRIEINVFGTQVES